MHIRHRNDLLCVGGTLNHVGYIMRSVSEFRRLSTLMKKIHFATSVLVGLFF